MSFVDASVPCDDGSCLSRHDRLIDRVGLDAAVRDEILETVAEHTMLSEVVRWTYEFEPPAEMVEIVQQDEYSLDVIIRWPRPEISTSDLYLVYDSS